MIEEDLSFGFADFGFQFGLGEFLDFFDGLKLTQ